jgi:hypothetical protein
MDCRIVEGQPDAECGPAVRVGLEVDCSVVALDDDRVRDRESLASAASNRLGGEERIENAARDLDRDPATGIADGDQDTGVVGSGSDGDRAALVCASDAGFDRVAGVDDQVETHLVEIAAAGHHQRELSEVKLDVGDVLVFVSGDNQRGLEALVDVDRGALGRGVRELTHRVHDRGDAVDPVQGPLDCGWDPLGQVFEIGVLLSGLRAPLAFLLVDRLIGVQQVVVDVGERQQLVGRALEERHRVTDKLHWRVDLVRDTGGELTDGFELLRQAQIKLQALAFEFGLLGPCDVEQHRLDTVQCFV